MKKFLKIFLFLLLFIFAYLKTFALEVNLTSDKNEIGVGDIFNINFELKSDNPGVIEIKGVKNIEKFDIVGQSQSQSSSSQVVIINGKTKSQNIITYNLVLSLRAKEKGEFEIGPAIIKQNGKEIKSNSISINVKDGIGSLMQKHTNFSTNLTNKQNFGNNNGVKKNIDTPKDEFEKINKKNFNNTNAYILIFLIIVLIILYLLYKEYEKKNFSKTENKKIEKENFEETEELDFEEKQKVIYPELNDPEFIKKAEKALRQVLANKYKIKNIDSLTFEEIQTQIGDKLDLKEIFDMINKAKYSNIITDYSKILDFIQKI